jgi:hypothetical protein
MDTGELGINPQALVKSVGNELDVLKKLVEDSELNVLESNYDTKSLEVNTGCGTVTIVIDNEKTREHTAYGLYEYRTSTIYISTERPQTAAELITILHHEVNHHILDCLCPNGVQVKENYYLYSTQIEYMKELVERAKKAGLKNPFSLKFWINERFIWLI